MPSVTDQNPAVQAMSQRDRALAQGTSEFLNRLHEDSPEALGGLAPSAWSAGPTELMELHAEWVKRHAELLQGVLDQPGGRPGAQSAEVAARDEGVDGPALPARRASDYLRQARQINADCLKNLVDASAVRERPAQDRMHLPTGQKADAVVPANVAATAAQATVSKYQEIRDKLKSGDIIVCCKGNMKSFKGFLSLLVRVVTASSYSHVGVVIKLGNRCFVVEATPPVVRLYPLSKLDSFYVIKMEQRLSREDENRLFEYVGLPYSDWNSIVSYFTRKPLANGKLQCAQLVSSFYNWPNLLRPEQIVRYAQEDLGKQMVFVR